MTPRYTAPQVTVCLCRIMCNHARLLHTNPPWKDSQITPPWMCNYALHSANCFAFVKLKFDVWLVRSGVATAPTSRPCSILQIYQISIYKIEALKCSGGKGPLGADRPKIQPSTCLPTQLIHFSLHEMDKQSRLQIYKISQMIFALIIWSQLNTAGWFQHATPPTHSWSIIKTVAKIECVFV